MSHKAASQRHSRNFFIVSKPIQYITARNLAEQLENSTNILLLITKFSGAEDLYFNAAKDKVWSSIVKAKTRSGLILRKLARYGAGGDLYTDSDIFMSGVTNKLICLSGEISVYEEGFYSYLPDISSHLQQQGKKTKNLIYKTLKLNTSHGESRFTKKLFLYAPDACEKALRIEKINTSTIEYIQRNIEALCHAFSIDPSSIRAITNRDTNTPITIYCTSHNLENYKKNSLTTEIDLVKPHPIFKSTTNFNHPTISPSVPIEIIVVILNKMGRKIHLVHEGSTALFYLAPLLKSGNLSQENFGTFASQLDTAYSNLLRKIESQ